MRGRTVIALVGGMMLGGLIVAGLVGCSTSARGSGSSGYTHLDIVHTQRGDITCALSYNDQGISCDWEHPQ